MAIGIKSLKKDKPAKESTTMYASRKGKTDAKKLFKSADDEKAFRSNKKDVKPSKQLTGKAVTRKR